MPIFSFKSKKSRILWAERIKSIDSDLKFAEALKTLFQIQSASIPALKLLGSPLKIRSHHWKKTPALPQRIFKATSLLPSNQSSVEFHTSGTTTGSPGIHRMRDSILYDTATECGLPWKSNAPFTILSLHPDVTEAPHSSLSAMIHHWIKVYGNSKSHVFFKKGKIESEKLWDFLQLKPSNKQPPLLIIGTAFSFVHLFDAWGKNHPLKLPKNTVIMETGGYKGRSRELPKKELYRLIQKHFGVEDSQIWNEYGMTELSSQAYAQGVDGLHHTPPWARVVIIDPQTGNEVPIGKRGVVKWYDLANVDSSAGIQTLDFAIRRRQGFQLLGRAPQTEKRGCSLTLQ